jgi:hypothetical protein
MRFLECGGKPARRRFGLVDPNRTHSLNGDHNPKRPKVLPLPEGEGWGEGKGTDLPCGQTELRLRGSFKISGSNFRGL